ncbi:hypothetical protein [Zobellella sp. An-6]|uniref:hypothetical protein n=1 Tax=Zobellella sp. An-6 TaxID=3400218 RepID=UPI0040414707
MEQNINKYGLKRYIPADIRSKIRKNSGFGCVICGCVLVDYEHIEPEFHNAKEHDPDKMTLLCISCHGRVTRKLISKNQVWEARSNPKALQDGAVHDLLFTDTENMEIRIGNSRYKDTKVILTIHGKPILWFEPPVEENELYNLCAIFCDDSGKPISYVNRNQFIAFSSNQDVKSESTILTIHSGGFKCLEMDREGGEVINISRMKGRYLDTQVTVNAKGELLMKQGESKFTLGEIQVNNCGSAISIGSHPAVRKYNRLYLAIYLASQKAARQIKNLKSSAVGWELGGEIFNKKYELVGFLRGNEVFTIANEYIGNLVGSYVSINDNCYETGEPIYISQENVRFKNSNPNIGFDVSFRLFADGI